MDKLVDGPRTGRLRAEDGIVSGEMGGGAVKITFSVLAVVVGDSSASIGRRRVRRGLCAIIVRDCLWISVRCFHQVFSLRAGIMGLRCLRNLLKVDSEGLFPDF